MAHSNFVQEGTYPVVQFQEPGGLQGGYAALGPVQAPIHFQEGQWLWVVSKATRSLNVYYFTGKIWEKKKSFPIAYGEKEGNKQRLGDLKTPEGNYWVNNMIPGTARGKRYGALIFSLNFPNAQDKAEGKTGAGIWIHGPEFGEGLEATRGCIKLSNKHLLELLKNCRGPIPVKILGKDRLSMHPANLDIDWVAKEFPLWKSRYERHSFLTLDWRKEIYYKARAHVQKEQSWIESRS